MSLFLIYVIIERYMKYTQLLFAPQKQAPANAETMNHRLLVQAGFVRQTMAGVYTYTDLGLRVLNKIAEIVREEMLALGSHEILMPALTPKANWVTSGGWDAIDVLFKIKSQTNREYALAQSHEEVVTPLMKEVIQSSKDLPKSIFQIQWKFRDELRAKSGILRGREFLMKDMYSFHLNEEDFLQYYEAVKKVYMRVFERLGLRAYMTEASGGNFTKKISYEYMVLTDAGEDNILYCSGCNYCVNEEIADEDLKKSRICSKCGGRLEVARASEAGNVFDLGTKFTQAFDLSVRGGKNGKEKIYPVMGCYGIGISRAMGIIVEKWADEKGIVWPESVAPFKAELISLGDEKSLAIAQDLYQKLSKAGIEVLWDDRADVSAGVKFAGADLIGCPWRLVVSPKTAGKVEVKSRRSDKTELLMANEIQNFFKKEESNENTLS